MATGVGSTVSCDAICDSCTYGPASVSVVAAATAAVAAFAAGDDESPAPNKHLAQNSLPRPDIRQPACRAGTHASRRRTCLGT